MNNTVYLFSAVYTFEHFVLKVLEAVKMGMQAFIKDLNGKYVTD